MILNKDYLKVKNINTIKDLEELNPSFVSMLSEMRKKQLVETIKNKEKYEVEFKKEFWKRFNTERMGTTFYMFDFSFGYIGTLPELFYNFFLQKSKELPIVDSVIKNEIAMMNYNFYTGILNTTANREYSEVLGIYKKEISSLIDMNDDGIRLKMIPEGELEGIMKDKYGAEIVEDFTNEMFESTIVANEIYSEGRDSTTSNGFLLYSITGKSASFYLRNTLSLKDIHTIGLNRRFLKKKYGVDTVKMFVIKDDEQFKKYFEKVELLIRNSIRKWKNIKDDGLKVWILNSLTNKNVGDFSFFLNKATGFQKTETLYEDSYKTVSNLDKTSMETLNSDFKEVLGVKIEGENTDGDFNIGRVNFRLNVYSCKSSYAVSIRNNAPSKMYSLKEVSQNGIDTNGLLWGIGEKEEQVFPLINKSYIQPIEVDGKVLDIQEFGIGDFLSEEDSEKAKKQLEQKEGLNLVSGSTGSGKSTLLRAFYTYLYAKFFPLGANKKIVYIENPVEDFMDNFYQVDFRNENSLNTILEKTIKRMRADVVVLGEARNDNEFNGVLNLTYQSQTSTTLHKGTMMDLLGYIMSVKSSMDIKTILSKSNMYIVLIGAKKFNLNQFAKENKLYLEQIKKYKNVELSEMLASVFEGAVSKKDVDDFIANHKINPINWMKTTVPKEVIAKYIKKKMVYEIAFEDDLKALYNRYADSLGMMDEEHRRDLNQNLFDIYDITGLDKTFNYQFIKMFLSGNLPDISAPELSTALSNVKGWKPEHKKQVFEYLKRDFPRKEDKIPK